jgi:oxygen-independent coproporphyrinogen-3 oxidase
VFGKRRARGELAELAESEQAELFVLTHEVLADSGFEGYEVSNFAAAPRHRSRHNLKYWRHRPYLGLGPSAHSFDGRRRRWNIGKERLWRAALERGEEAVAGVEVLQPGQLLLETVMLGLRTRDGIELDRLRALFGCDLAGANGALLDALEEAGLVRRRDHRLVLSVRGLAVVDGVVRRLDLALEEGP